jgi:hypothetical protein
VDVTQNVYNRTWWEERVEAVSMAAATVWSGTPSIVRMGTLSRSSQGVCCAASPAELSSRARISKARKWTSCSSASATFAPSTSRPRFNPPVGIRAFDLLASLPEDLVNAGREKDHPQKRKGL